MGKPLRVAIIDDDDAVTESARVLIFSRFMRLELAGTAKNGLDGLDLIVEQMPDCAIIDMEMPIRDGNTLLRRLRALSLTTRICCIALGSYEDSDRFAAAIESGAHYYFIKPLGEEHINSIPVIYENFRRLYPRADEHAAALDVSAPEEPAPNAYAAQLLRLLGIPPGSVGFVYLRDAIAMCVKESGYLDRSLKLLYIELAEMHKTRAERVERSIRHTLDHADKEGKLREKCFDMFGESYSKRPSNGKLLEAAMKKFMDTP